MEQTLTMQYIEIFSSVKKNENFMRKNDIFEHVFSLKFSQNIDCGYTLETLHRFFLYIYIYIYVCMFCVC